MRRSVTYLRIIARQTLSISRTVAIPRLYCRFPLADAVQVALAPDAAHHAAKVLRLRRGDEAVLFDGSGGEYAASIHHVGRDGVLVDVGRHRAEDRESPLRICLAQGLATGDKMDTILQKAVELGVTAFQPLLTQKSVVKLTDERAERRALHWQQVVIAACEQCGRNCLPEVRPVEQFDAWVVVQTGARMLLMPGAPQRLADTPKALDEITLLTGPESGFSSTETQLALTSGFTPVRLGPRVLRTETAGLAALAAIQTLWGDF